MSVRDEMYLEPEMALIMWEYLRQQPKHGRMLEIGTGHGHSTAFFSELKSKWKIYTVDGFGMFGDGRIYPSFEKEHVEKVFKYLKGHENVIQIIGNSNELTWELELNALYIDGGHFYECCKTDFNRFSPFIKIGGIIIFHDYWREDFGVKQVVTEALELGFELLHESRIAIIKKYEDYRLRPKGN